jgi:plastocyanin
MWDDSVYLEENQDMRRTTGLVTGLSAAAALVLSLVILQTAQTTASASMQRATRQVAIMNFAFSPASLTVAVGTTVTWTNKDSVGHTVTSDTGAWPDSGVVDTGKSFSFTFSKAGKFTYHCSIHPTMTASITVGGSSGMPNNSGGPMMSMGPSSKISLTSFTAFYDNKAATYVSTDTSSKSMAAQDHINYSATLGKAIGEASLMYFPTNGRFASHGAVLGTAPGETDYTPLWQVVLVTWKNAGKAVALGSDNQINALAAKGLVTVKHTGIVLNCPIVYAASHS